MTVLPPFQRLLDEHSDAVWRYLVATVGRADADDVYQETLMSALRAYPRLDPQRTHALRGWLLTIAHSRAMDHFNAAARRAVPLADPPEVAVRDPEPAGDDALWARVDGLPPKMRAAVALRYAADLSHAEVGAALGCSEAAARRSTFEGLKRLRAQVAA